MSDREWRKQLKTSPVHAYFLVGDEQAVKRAAQQASAVLLCERENDAPCGVCQACQWMAAHSHPDFHHVESDKKRARPIIRMETIRLLQEELHKKPQKKYRVVWIEDAHTMRAEAQNALLKVLEDPPEHLIFLLSGQRFGVLPTVRSRCRMVHFCDEHPQALSKEEIATAGNLLLLFFRDGSRQAQYLLSEQKQNMSIILRHMVILLREIMAQRADAAPADEASRAWVQNHAITWSLPLLSELAALCMETEKRLKANANVALCADWVSIKARHLFLCHRQEEKQNHI